MYRLISVIVLTTSALLPNLSFASLQGKWNVTEFVTVKTTAGKLVDIQAQKNLTAFNFNSSRGFTRTYQDATVLSGTYRENTRNSSFNVSIPGKAFNLPNDINSLKSRIQANMAARGYSVITRTFRVQPRSFTGQIYNQSVLGIPPDLVAEDAHIIQGKYSYVVYMSVANGSLKYNMKLIVESTFSGSKDATDISSSPEEIANKAKLWPLF